MIPMLRLTGGKVYDPANGVHGEVRDICIEGGKIVADVTGGKVLNCAGMVILPGGVDIHTHVAGAALNFARAMTPENQRVAQARGGEEAGHGRGLAPGEEQRVDAGEVVRRAHLDRVDTEGLEHLTVLPEGALECEDPGLHGVTPPTRGPAASGCRRGEGPTWGRSRHAHEPRPANGVSIFEISRPGIASPRPRETLATMDGSA